MGEPTTYPSAAARKLALQFPTYDGLRRRAYRRLPKFAFDFLDTGAGAGTGVERNERAFSSIEMAPRFGRDVSDPDPSVTLFGRNYALPVGIAPMGLPGFVWPGADWHLAAAAQRARIPFTLGVGASMTIEEAAKIAPDVLWFQLARMPKDDHAIAFDLIRRADAAGAHVLALTIDGSARPKRPRDMRNNTVPPFRLHPKMMLQALAAPRWTLELARRGAPGFSNVHPYMGKSTPSVWDSAAFIVREVNGSFRWDEVKRIRDLWPRALVVKGLGHPEDAELAARTGVDGVWISNHGGRHFEPAPPAIDVLPSIAAAVGDRLTVIMDSGIRNGPDVLRALRLGADAVFAGRAFLMGVAALGDAGADHVARMFTEELRNSMAFLGARTVAELSSVSIRHATAMEFDPLSNAR
jgi:L-lactate dehydrogenase (cytochrome)